MHAFRTCGLPKLTHVAARLATIADLIVPIS